MLVHLSLFCLITSLAQEASCGLLGFGSDAPRPQLQPPRTPINRRMGPFVNRNQAPLHHPYMQQPNQHWVQPPQQRIGANLRYESGERLNSAEFVNRQALLDSREQPSTTQPPKRVLMPIISEGYASTKKQGSRYGVSEPAKKKDTVTNDLVAKVEKPDVEPVVVEEIVKEEDSQPPTTVASTSIVVTEAQTESVVNIDVQVDYHAEEDVQESKDPVGQVIAQDESSPYFPDIPDTVALSATEDVSQTSANINRNDVTAEAVDIQPSEKDPFQEPTNPYVGVGETPQQGKGSVESVSLFDEVAKEEVVDDSEFIVQPGEDVPLDVESGQFVRFVADPPKQIKVVVPNVQAPVPPPKPINVDNEGYFKPPKVEPSDTYQAGYQQIDFPNSGGQFPGSVNPDLIDPNDYHEDRPSFSSGTNKQAVREYYPLGKPPAPSPATEETPLRAGPPPRPEQPVESGKPAATSFLDFLIPSFIRGNSRTDPEGPTKPAFNTNLRPSQPNPKLPPVPNRPPNTFPHPQELGGKENPIPIRLGPDGLPLLPPPPGWNRPQDTLARKKLYKPDPEIMEETTDSDTLLEDGIYAEPVENKSEFESNIQTPKLKLPSPPPQLPPSSNRQRPAHAPMPTTVKPFITFPRISLGKRPPPPQQQQQRISTPTLPKQRQLLDSKLIPNKPEFTSVHDQMGEDDLVVLKKTADYKDKLADPEFFQNLTKAHVFHDTNLDNEDEINSGIISGPIKYAPVFQIQDLNPFGKKDDEEGVLFQPEIPQDPQFQTSYHENPFQQAPPSLEEFAPPSKSVHQGLLHRPEVVYDPEEDAQYSFSNRKGPDFDVGNRPNIYETFLRNSLVPEYKSEYIQNPIRVATEAPEETETEETTEAAFIEEGDSEVTESEFEVETTTPADPIADHVNKLLRHYLTSERPMKGVPSLLFDDETGSVVLEYISPDGEHGTVEQIGIQDMTQADAIDLQAFKAVPEFHENEDTNQNIEHESEDADLAYTNLDQVFVPSSQVQDSDWFVMDKEGKKRIMHYEFADRNQQPDTLMQRVDIEDNPESDNDAIEGQTETTPEFETAETNTEPVESATEPTFLHIEPEGGFFPVPYPAADLTDPVAQ